MFMVTRTLKQIYVCIPFSNHLVLLDMSFFSEKVHFTHYKVQLVCFNKVTICLVFFLMIQLDLYTM